MLHGPGNSQPHKMALCPGGHEVDVHALKAKGLQKQCAAVTTSGNVTSHAAAVSVVGGVQVPTAAGVGPTAAGVGPQGGVLGVTAAQSQPAGGVLGAIEAVGQGKLPFTGFPLWVAALVAVALIALGLGLRRGARTTV
jgi:hypothetical protein